MPQPVSKAFLAIALLIAATLTVASTRANAGGSIALTDAMTNFDAPPKLIDEIEAAVRDANMKADDVICDAARFGRHWINLGGGRASPYECPIGARKLVITGGHEYRDAMGKILPQDGLGLENHAATVRDVDITWEWK